MLENVVTTFHFYFLQGNVPEDNTRCTVEKPCVIEGFYDSKEHVIYLHLQSEYDACQMAQLCQKAAQQISSMVSFPKLFQFQNDLNVNDETKNNATEIHFVGG